MNLQPIWDWFRTLHETTGIDLTIFYDAFDRARFLNGFLTSIRLMAVCIVCSVVIGVVGACNSRFTAAHAAADDASLHPVLPQHAAPRSTLFLLFRARRLFARGTASGISSPLVSNFTWAAICLSFWPAPSM